MPQAPHHPSPSVIPMSPRHAHVPPSSLCPPAIPLPCPPSPCYARRSPVMPAVPPVMPTVPLSCPPCPCHAHRAPVMPTVSPSCPPSPCHARRLPVMPTVSLSCPPFPCHARHPSCHSRSFKRESRKQPFVLCYDLAYDLTVLER